MTNLHHNKRQERNLSPQSAFVWTHPLLFGIIGLALFLLFASNTWWDSPAEQPKQREPQTSPHASQASEVSRPKPPLGQTNSRPRVRQQLPTPPPDTRSIDTQPKPLAQPLDSVQGTWQLNDLVTRLKGQKEISGEKVKDIKRLLRELRKQGAAAIPAIREFLRQKGDVNFAMTKGGELLDQATLRQAVMNTLQKIGGDESLAVSLEVLSGTQDPAEIALLARNLEKEAPGVYRQEALHAVNSALRLWAGAKEQVEARPLFELLRDLGGPEAVAILAQFPANADTVQYQRNRNQDIPLPWKVYSLIALMGLPDGEGIPVLAALAGDPTVPVEHKPTLPFQMLAQSAMDYAEAGKTLVDLARAGQIPDRAWKGLGEVLAGNYWQFPSQLSGGATPDGEDTDRSGVEAPLMRTYTNIDGQHILKYEQRTVSVDWSQKQINREIALIDNLLNATSSPTAKQALQQARDALQSGGRVVMK